MRIIKILFFLFTAVGMAQQRQIPVSATSNFRNSVENRADEIKTMSGDFVQVKYIQMMQAESVSAGRLYFKSPEVLKWEYYKPYSYQMLFKEGQMFVDDEGEKSVTNLRSNKIFEKLVSLISGSVNGKLMADTDNFDITYIRVNADRMVVLVPRDAVLRQMFAQIVLKFNRQNLVDTVKLVEESGDFTEIHFKNISINKQIDPKVFKE